MNCKNCGNPLMNDDLFCAVCGAKVEPYDDGATEEKAEEFVQDTVGKTSETETTDDGKYTFNAYDPQNEQHDSVPEINATDRQTSVETNVPTAAQPVVSDEANKSKNIDIKISKKKFKTIVIVAICLVAALIIGIVAFKLISNMILRKPIVINMNEYMVSDVITENDINAYYDAHQDEEYDDIYLGDDGYYDDDYYNEEMINNYYSNQQFGNGLIVNGYDSYASIYEYGIENTIDWEALKSEINSQLAKKFKKNDSVPTFGTVFGIEEFSFTADKMSDISNGDTITVTVEYLPGKVLVGDSVTIEFYSGSKSYTVDGLKAVNGINPFKFVSLSYNGANGYASLSCVVDEELSENIEGLEGFKAEYYDQDTVAITKDGYIIAKILYSIPDEYDTSNHKNGDIVYMYCYSPEGQDLESEYNIYIVKNEQRYELSTIGDYINSDYDISADLNAFKTYAESWIAERYNDSSSYSNFKFNSAYLVDLKDKTEQNNYFHNELCLIYSYQYTGWFSEAETNYLYITFSNLISYDGKIKHSAKQYQDDYGTGYDSSEEILDKLYDAAEYITKKQA